MPQDITTLELSTLDELIDEVGKRLDNVVIIGRNPIGEDGVAIIQYQGSLEEAIGMCKLTEKYLLSLVD